jgi:adenine phosphoribosyltransferase
LTDRPGTGAEADLRAFIRTVPDFPKPGIQFRDITPLLLDPAARASCIRQLAACADPPDAVVAIESRGFIFGAALAQHWNTPFVPARKFGKLPGRTVRTTYSLEYGVDSLELHADALTAGQSVVIVDDLLATGGTAAATIRLVEQLGAQVTALLFVIELTGLGGRQKLVPHVVRSLVELPG